MKLSAWMLALTSLTFLYSPLIAAEEEGEYKVYTIETEIEVQDSEEYEEEQEDDWLPFDLVLSGRIGVDHAAVGEDQHVLINEDARDPNHFLVNDPWETKMVWGGFLGIELPIFDSRVYSWQTGAAYYNTNPFNVEGIVTTNGDAAAAELDFEYKVRNQRIMWENKIFAKLNERFSVYFLGGIGGAINKAYHFEETPRDPRNTVDPYFDDNTKNSFTWSAGLGVEMWLWENFRGSLGYQFSELGKVELGELDGTDVSSETLSAPNTQTHEFIFGLSYVY